MLTHEMDSKREGADAASFLLEELNPPQREAVATQNQNVLVLAGAGSGKTRVLVHRIAYLVKVLGVSPYSIFAVTFTNKAAREMAERVEQLLGVPSRGLWIGTFHGLAHRLLRAHHKDAGLPEHFQIIDSQDQLSLVRRTIKQLGFDEARWPPKQAQWFINQKKQQGLRPHQVNSDGDPLSGTLIDIYGAYQKSCDDAGLVDFVEILLRTTELLRNTPEVLAHYQNRFRYLLVDEFQDTNGLQYAWFQLMTSPQTYTMVVGDDDQSIYGWRGADIENIRSFTKDFPGAQTIRLEQNYRSTETILSAANAVIDHNGGRLGKSLWTDSGQGAPISLYAAFNDSDEASFIVNSIRQWYSEGHSLKDAAVLYRSNAQSRIIEEVLMSAGLPYRVYGGLRFFERAEIKDALAYLRLLANRQDDSAFERIINTPTRGIGDRTVGELRDLARAQGCSLWQASEVVLESKQLSPRAGNCLAAFVSLINSLTDDIQELPLPQQVEATVNASGLREHFKKEKGEKAQTRLENLDELVNAAGEFALEEGVENPMEALQAFISAAALEAGDDQSSPHEDCVQLMTLHSAKGLEFPLVILSGMEEGLFPHSMSLNEPGRCEEERRLCYVGMTRAKEKLIMTYAEQRRLHGKVNYHLPSRFISEIPKQYIEEVRMKTMIKRPVSASPVMMNAPAGHRHPSAASAPIPAGDTGYELGQRVLHPKFGEGVVLNYEGNGDTARVQVKFSKGDAKWLVLSYAKLEIL